MANDTLTIIDPQDYSPDEYNLVAVPGEALKHEASHIQKRLTESLGNKVWFTPSHALHMTVMEITGPFSQPVSSRAKYFEQWQHDYGQTAKDIIARFPPIKLRFNQVHASERAIILKAADPTPLNVLREAILSKTRLPANAKLPPDIAHISLARYSKTVSLGEVMQAVSEVTIDLTEIVTSFSILHDVSPPDFNVTTIATYPFAIKS